METPKLVYKLIICPIHLHSLATVALDNYLSRSVRTCFFFFLNLIAHIFRTDRSFGFPVVRGVSILDFVKKVALQLFLENW